ncbi:TIGR04283 family arsenosugar biosynthesis glycosyltransferase [bacterium]|nr:TIGR04283 family arsenosugar biosynthesis glycosyltransferase [bacterium]
MPSVSPPDSDIAAKRIAAVIPALNEAGTIAECLRAILAETGVTAIVADGGSRDGTVEIAARFPNTIVITSAPGRARQMNAGAAAAQGEILVFCHADTILPKGWADAVRATLADPGVALGAFRFALPGRRAAYRVIEWGVALRCALFDLPYGDQALFVRAADLPAGGFAPPPAMEDVEFVRAMRRRGGVALLPAPAVTSDRAWRRNGAIRRTLANWSAALRYRFLARSREWTREDHVK